MKIDLDRKLIERYLLGELAEADQTALELEMLTDNDKFEEVGAVENELIDSYVRGEMSRADQDRFEDGYLVSPLHRERVAIAESSLARTGRLQGERVGVMDDEPAVPWWNRWLDFFCRPQIMLGGALILALLWIFSAVWSYLERVRLTAQITSAEIEARLAHASSEQREQEQTSRIQELESALAGERGRRQELTVELERQRRQPPAIFSFLLPSAPVRSEKYPSPLTIPLLTAKIRLLMELNGNGYRSYRARLQTVEGKEIRSRRMTGIKSGKDRSFAMLTIPAGDLTGGDYLLILFGRTAEGTREEVDRYFFRVL